MPDLSLILCKAKIKTQVEATHIGLKIQKYFLFWHFAHDVTSHAKCEEM